MYMASPALFPIGRACRQCLLLTTLPVLLPLSGRAQKAASSQPPFATHALLPAALKVSMSALMAPEGEAELR